MHVDKKTISRVTFKAPLQWGELQNLKKKIFLPFSKKNIEIFKLVVGKNTRILSFDTRTFLRTFYSRYNI